MSNRVELAKTFSHLLKERLLTDNYGKWKELDNSVLDCFCDRAAETASELILKLASEQGEELVCDIQEVINNAIDNMPDHHMFYI